MMSWIRTPKHHYTNDSGILYTYDQSSYLNRTMAETTGDVHRNYEPVPDPEALTGRPDGGNHVEKNVDYEPHPEKSLQVSAEHQAIINGITNLYDGSCSEEDMKVYAEKAM